MGDCEQPRTELEELRHASERMAASLGTDEAIETNAAILDLAPGDPVATNRLGIGLLRTRRPAEALTVLEIGLRVHPDNAIMRKRLLEAQSAVKRRSPGVGATSTRYANLWQGLDVEHLVAASLAGPGKEASLRFCADSLRASEALDKERTAVTPIKSGDRFRVIGGIFTGCGPWKDLLTVSVRKDAHTVIGTVHSVGGVTVGEAVAVPCVQLGVPRVQMAEIYDLLLPAHEEHLKLSIEYAPPTHANKHNEALRQYLLNFA